MEPHDSASRPAAIADQLLAGRTRGLASSAIRDLLALTSRADVISLAGGLPDAGALPAAWLREAAQAVLSDAGPAALQYSTTEGHEPLRRLLAGWESDWCGRPVGTDDVLVTHGSQQALTLLATTLVDPGDVVVVDDPAYLGALQVLRLHGARLVGVPHDALGMRTDLLAEQLRHGLRPKLVYTTATYANPGGTTLAADRRAELAALADRHGFVVVEDDAYRRLSFADPPPPPVAASSGAVVRLGSFSKVLSPGLRVGWVVAPEPLRTALVRAKQAADLHTSTFAQLVVTAMAGDEKRFAAHVETVRKRYARRAAVFVAALDRAFGDRLTVTAPAGGMFVWATFTDATDTTALLPAALEAGVAYVPGSAFAVETPWPRSLRLCFASYDDDVLTAGVQRLARAAGG